MKIFFIYRFIISSLFILLFYGQYDLSAFKTGIGELFLYSSHFYLSFSIIAGICAFKRYPSYPIQAQIVIFTDILFITLLMHAGGGINSGIGFLLVVSIAASGLLIGGHCSLIFAALAGLSIIAEQFYAYQVGDSNKTSFVYAGMLGTSFFALTYLSQIIVKRTEQSELLASQQEQTIFNLEELNQYIIQHLQSGIIICNSLQQIKTINEAALTLCKYQDKTKIPLTLTDISTNLVNGFQLWTMDNHHNFALIKLADDSEIQVRFSLLQTQAETFHMIILEDSLLHNQRLQQSKLASLGYLTASIAHEIRNPLGAISHAGQLLAEAPTLSSQDQRLTTIIQSHCQRVNKIIEDILQLSRRSPSKKEKIEINQWIKNYLKNFIQISNDNIEQFDIISTVDEFWIHMDVNHLKQILDNLCSNALKYGNPSKQKIILTISLYKENPIITFIDHGPEIEPATVAHLFEPFFTTSSTGTGLGLYISKELAELNQANLSYALGSDNKKHFTLLLPSANNSTIEI